MKTFFSLPFWLLALCCLGLAGCASQPPRRLEHFPSAAELGTPEHRQSEYRQARIDFRRAASGQPPRYARVRTAWYDGGTIFYRGSGYDLTVWHRCVSGGAVGYVYAGPEISFDRSLSPRGAASYSVATTRKLSARPRNR